MLVYFEKYFKKQEKEIIFSSFYVMTDKTVCLQ